MGIKDSAYFRKAANKAFKEIDMDGTGCVDYKEVRLAAGLVALWAGQHC
jgi:Ca2+-binding EF-hand superfamily protein